MKYSKPDDTLVTKGDNFSLNFCPKDNMEIQEILGVPYALAMGSLIHDLICTHQETTYIVGSCGRYLSNSSLNYYKRQP